MSTLVLCVDRSDTIGRAAGLETPIVGWEAVRSLVIEVGLADPEDTSVNTLLEGLRVARDLRDEGDRGATIAVISGTAESMVSADRSVARQIDQLIEELEPTSAVVLVDSAQDEQVVPIVESRIPVDGVNRIVVRQARDIESTYYLLKQFLADEELRQTTLVPLGVTLLAFPLLMTQTSPEIALASITAVIGIFLLYKGLGVDEYVAGIPGWVRRSLYSGRVSIVTYVVAGGLAVIGLFAGVLGVSSLAGDTQSSLLLVMQFFYDSVAWLAMAALVGSMGRLMDAALRDGYIPGPYLNIPFGVLAVGIVIRGFAGYFLQEGEIIDPVNLPPITVGQLSVDAFSLTAGQRLAGFVILGIIVSLVGVRVSTYFGDLDAEEFDSMESVDR